MRSARRLVADLLTWSDTARRVYQTAHKRRRRALGGSKILERVRQRSIEYNGKQTLRSHRPKTSCGVQPAMEPTYVDINSLIPPSYRAYADPDKLARHGDFDWDKYTPIIVETDGMRFWVMDGMTRIENARRAGIKKLPAYIFPRR